MKRLTTFLLVILILGWVLPVAAQDDGEAEELTNTYDMDPLIVTLPEDWGILPAEDRIIIGTTRTAADGPDLTPGEGRGFIFYPQTVADLVEGEPTLQQLSQQFINSLNPNPAITPTLEEMRTLIIGGHPAVLQSGYVTPGVGATLIAVDLGGEYVIVVMAGERAVLERVQPTLIDIVANLEYNGEVVGPVSSNEPIEVDLTEHFVSETGTLEFDYPEGWFVNEETGIINLASEQLDADNDKLGADEAAGFVFHPDITEFLIGSSTSLEDAPAALVDSLVTVIGTDDAGEESEFDDPQEIEINGNRAVEQYVTDGDTDLYVIVMELPDGNRIAMTIGTGSDSIEGYAAVLLSMAESLTYTSQVSLITPPREGEVLPLTDTYVSVPFQMSVAYPADWIAFETPQYIVLNNADIPLDANGAYLPKAVQLVIFPPVSSADYHRALNLDTDASNSDILARYVTDYVLAPQSEAVSEDLHPVQVGDKAGYTQFVESTNGDGLYYLMEQADGSLILVVAAAATSYLTPYQSSIEAIIASLQPLPEE